ncbi:MAG: family 78 glycoside hydrolase catalytic domain [Aristaeellaceae bacterium]
MVCITRILMDYLTHPVGVEEMPVFSWRMESDATNVIQTAYQLQIAPEASFAAPLYDSGRTVSDESAHVTVPGVTLRPCTAYFVRVRVWTSAGESDWSAPVSFVTGMTDHAWQARFISAETADDWSNSRGTYLRRAWLCEKAVKEAYICATALGLYHLSLNGVPVGDDQMAPGWTSYHHHLCYQTYDVTHLLRRGENVLGAHLGAGWYKGMMGFILERNNYGDQTALLLQMTIRYEDGTEETLVTDESWLGCASPVTFSEIYDGERFDARLDQPGWNAPGFTPAMGEPLPLTNPKPARDRLVQPLTDAEKAAQRVRARDYQPVDTLWRRVGIVDAPLSVLTPQPGCRVGITQELPVKEIITTPQGDTVLDFGQNITGWVRFRVRAKAGELVHIRCFETLDAQGNAYFDNLRTALAEVRYICRGDGEETYQENFSFQGFRYAKLEAWPGEIHAEDFTGCVVHSRMEKTGQFACSNPLLNQLQSNIDWSLRDNFLDIPTDCPQRDERMGWTGDAQIFCRTACFLRGAYPFFSKWLKDVAFDQTEEGGVPHIVPNSLQFHHISDWLLGQGTHSAAAWADVAVLNPWTLYLTYGDKRILREQFDSMRKWIDFMRTHSVDHIWNYKLQFGDWVALDAEEGSYFGATPNDLTCTAYYAHSTAIFVNICRVLGKDELAAEYQQLYEQIAAKFRQTFLDENGVMTVQTQTAHIVALYFGLIPEEGRAGTVAGLKRLLDKENGHLVTGFVGTPYFCHALSQNGCKDEAYNLLLKEDFPSWLYQVKTGATTVWEHWDGLKPDGTMWSPDMNSFNHYAYGAIGEWLYRVVAGIEIDEAAPGYKHAIIAPMTGGGLTYVQSSYDSLYGDVAVRWERQGNAVTLTVSVPANTSATILLEEGATAPEAAFPVSINAQNRWEARVGSGCWRVAYTL